MYVALCRGIAVEFGKPQAYLSADLGHKIGIEGGAMRSYQIESLQFFLKLYSSGVGGGILADEMVCWDVKSGMKLAVASHRSFYRALEKRCRASP